MFGEEPRKNNESPLSDTAALLSCSLFAISVPRLSALAIAALLLKTIVVATPENGACGAHVAVLQFPALAVVKVVGVGPGVTLTCVELLLSTLPFIAETTKKYAVPLVNPTLVKLGA